MATLPLQEKLLFRPLAPEELDRITEHIRNPEPGGAVERAKAFGVDVTLIPSRLARTPEQRLDDLEEVVECVREFGEAGRRLRAREIRDRGKPALQLIPRLQL